MIHVCVPVDFHFQKEILICGVIYFPNAYKLVLYTKKKLIIECGFDINLTQLVCDIHGFHMSDKSNQN